MKKMLFENHGQDARYKGPLATRPTLSAQLGTGGNNAPLIVEVNDANNARVLCMSTGQARAEITENVAPCLNCNHEAPIAVYNESGPGYWMDGAGASGTNQCPDVVQATPLPFANTVVQTTPLPFAKADVVQATPLPFANAGDTVVRTLAARHDGSPCLDRGENIIVQEKTYSTTTNTPRPL